MNNTAFNLFADKVKQHYERVIEKNLTDPNVWWNLKNITEEVKDELEEEAKPEPITPVLADVHCQACKYAQLDPSFDRDEEQYYNNCKLAIYDAYIAGWKANV